MYADPMHLARLAQLEGALCALLRDAANDHDVNDCPDGVTATLNADGLDIEYTRGGLTVAGEGV